MYTLYKKIEIPVLYAEIYHFLFREDTILFMDSNSATNTKFYHKHTIVFVYSIYIKYI